VRVVTTGSRVARIVAKLKQFLGKIMDFLRNLAKRVGTVRQAFQRSMANKQVNSGFADIATTNGDKSPLVKLWNKDGMLGSRVQGGFGQAMTTAAGDAVKAQLGVGTRANAGVDKPLRNVGAGQKVWEYDKTGSDDTKQRIEGNLDI
jgi:hypothetical protein